VSLLNYNATIVLLINAIGVDVVGVDVHCTMYM